ncbi:hypothetical protein EIP86_000578 [Pleurotus ostreatoroseus]|nr:hypothetical protein EIP86_000578 [Pleurotus ostreatoroseus]
MPTATGAAADVQHDGDAMAWYNGEGGSKPCAGCVLDPSPVVLPSCHTRQAPPQNPKATSRSHTRAATSTPPSSSSCQPRLVLHPSSSAPPTPSLDTPDAARQLTQTLRRLAASPSVNSQSTSPVKRKDHPEVLRIPRLKIQHVFRA